jgi:predicted ATPase
LGTSLDRIEIQGFKSIGEAALDLRALNVLIGSNGAGKSNFIAVFQLLNQMIDQRLQIQVQRWGGADAILHRGLKQTQEVVLRLTFGRNSYLARLGAAPDGGLFFMEESCSCSYPEREPYAFTMGSGTRETGLIEEAAREDHPIARHVLGAIQSWKVYHFHDTSSSSKVKQLGDIGDNALLRPDASNLAAFLLLLREKHANSYKQIVRTVRLVAPFFGDFQLRPSPYNEQKIQLEWAEGDSDTYFNAHALSDGTLRFICLAALLLQPEPPSTVLIDEPELGLHPFAIQVLAGLLKQAATKTQVVVSTQSVTLVNQLQPEDLVVVDREDGQSVFKRCGSAEFSEWIEGYALGELWEKNVLGGRPS